MSPSRNKAITLVELLIAITLLALLVLGFSNLDVFTRYHITTADRRVQLQNEASYVLEHMAKQIGRAIGDTTTTPVEGTATARIEGDKAIKVWIDSNGTSGIYDATDRRVAYRYQPSVAPPGNGYSVLYYSNCLGPNCNDSGSSSPEVLAKHITSFDATYTSSNDYIDVSITACWDPDGTPAVCGSADNPRISLVNRIYMPAVSTH